MEKKVLCAFLATLMIIIMLPVSAFASTELQGDTNKNGTVDVYLTITEGTDGFYLPSTQKALINEKISVPYFDLALYGLADYYYNPDCYATTAQQPGTKYTAEGVVTGMHVFIYATEIYMCGMSEKEAGKGGDHIFEYISWQGGAGSSYMTFWNKSTNCNYYLDYKFPEGKPGWGSTSDQQALSDGTKIDIHLIKSTSAMGSAYSLFETSDGTLDMAEITEGESLELTLKKTTSSWSSTSGGLVEIPSESVYYISAKDYAGQKVSATYWKKLGSTDENGDITVPNNLEAGTYYISCIGVDSGSTERGPAAFTLVVKEKGSSGSNIKYGDINGDGEIDNIDAALVYAYHNGKKTFTSEQLKAADVNGDGEVDNIDAAFIYAYHNGKRTSFPAEK